MIFWINFMNHNLFTTHGRQGDNMDYVGRLAKAFEGTKFESVPNQNDAYPLIELGKRNIEEFEKLSDKRRAVIFDILSQMLAGVIQPRAIEKFGCADSLATASIIHDSFHFQQTMEQLGLDIQMRKEYVSIGLNEEDARALQESLMSYYATEFVQLITDLVNRWRLFPIAEAQSIALSLTDLMKEVGV
jgi:hypothetical protein